MGMDVYGINPSSEVGEYYRQNVWGWHPLADLCLRLAPEACAACQEWHSNSGDGLGVSDSTLLGEKLETCIAQGVVANYIAARDEALRSLPDDPCDYCNGTGVRCDDVGMQQRMHETIIDKPGHPRHGQNGTCNACDGRGASRPFATWYSLELEDVREFAEFLKACGGFKIW